MPVFRTLFQRATAGVPGCAVLVALTLVYAALFETSQVLIVRMSTTAPDLALCSMRFLPLSLSRR